MMDKKEPNYKAAPKAKTESPHVFLPDFCNLQALLFLLLTTELVVMALTLTIGSLNQDFWLLLGLRTLYAQAVALGSAALLCLLRPWLLHSLSAIGQGVLVLLLVGAMALGLGLLGHELLLPAEPLWPFVLRHLAVTLIFTGLLLRYLYIQYLQKQQAEAEARARFQALQSRIQPHFLFNSMNTIAGLTRSQPALAEQVVLDLADLFRASLNPSEQLSTLGEELALARQYLAIEQLRLGERLQLDWDDAMAPKGLPMPRLCLQPLVENAIYHGIERRLTPGVLRLRIQQDRQWLKLELCNAIAEPSLAATKRPGLGMALENILQRLRALHGPGCRLDHGACDELYCIRLLLPIHSKR
jgi:two-component system sensor histidine kinase AlgZ